MNRLLVLGFAGTCLGAALSAARHRAPRRTAAMFYVLSAVGLVVALTMGS